jgi:hypothetical protein
MTGAQVRAIARRLLDRSQLMQQEAISASAAGARRPAQFLDAMATGIREDALALARGFPTSSDGGGPPPDAPQGQDPPGSLDPDEPTNPTGGPKAA